MALPASPHPPDPSRSVLKWISTHLEKDSFNTIGHRDLSQLAKMLGIKGGWLNRKEVRSQALIRVQEIVDQWQADHAKQLLSSTKTAADIPAKLISLDSIYLEVTDEGRLMVRKNTMTDLPEKVRITLEANVRFHERLEYLSSKLQLSVLNLKKLLQNSDPPLIAPNGQLSEAYIRSGGHDFLEHPALKGLFSLSVIQEFLDGIDNEPVPFYQSGEVNPTALLETLHNFTTQLNKIEGLEDCKKAVRDRVNKMQKIVTAKSTKEGDPPERIWKQTCIVAEFLKASGFEYITDVGKGNTASGNVSLYQKGDKKIAVKVYHKDAPHRETIQDMAAISLASSRYIARPLFSYSNRLGEIEAVVFEYIDGKDLDTCLKDKTVTLSHISQLRQGLSTLHRVGLFHCDLHMGNVMISNTTGDLKIIDLGFSSRKGRLIGNNRRYEMSDELLIQAPPEMCRGIRATDRIDSWSFGVILASRYANTLDLSEARLFIQQQVHYILFSAYQELGEVERLDGESSLQAHMRVSLGAVKESGKTLAQFNLSKINEELRSARSELSSLIDQGKPNKRISILRQKIAILKERQREYRAAREIYEQNTSRLTFLFDSIYAYLLSLQKLQKPNTQPNPHTPELLRFIKSIIYTRETPISEDFETTLNHHLQGLSGLIKIHEASPQKAIPRLQEYLDKRIIVAADVKERAWIQKRIKGLLQIDPSKRTSILDLERDPFFKIHETLDHALNYARKLGIRDAEIHEIFCEGELALCRVENGEVVLAGRFNPDEAVNILEDRGFLQRIQKINRRLLQKAQQLWNVDPKLTPEQLLQFTTWCAMPTTTLVDIDKLLIQFINYKRSITKLRADHVNPDKWNDQLKKVGFLEETEDGLRFSKVSTSNFADSDIIWYTLVQEDSTQRQIDRFINDLVTTIMPAARLLPSIHLPQRIREYFVSRKVIQDDGLLHEKFANKSLEEIFEAVRLDSLYATINRKIQQTYLPALAKELYLPLEWVQLAFSLLGYNRPIYREGGELIPVEEMIMRLNSMLPILDMFLANDRALDDCRTTLESLGIVQDGVIPKECDISAQLKTVASALPPIR